MSTPAARPDRLDEVGAVGSDAQPGRPDRRDRRDVVLPGLVGHAGDRPDRAFHRLRLEPARLLEPLAQTGDLGAVDDRAPGPVRAPFADVELHRVRAHVDDRVPLRAEPDERLEAASEAHVRPRGQPELTRPPAITRAASSDSIAKVRVEAPPGAHLGQLGHAAADRVALPPLVHLDGEQVGVRCHHLGQELGERVRRAGQAGRGVHAERLEHRADVGRGQREPGLHHGDPLLEPVVVHAHEVLDVHQLVADLDGVGLPAPTAGRPRRSRGPARA